MTEKSSDKKLTYNGFCEIRHIRNNPKVPIKNCSAEAGQFLQKIFICHGETCRIQALTERTAWRGSSFNCFTLLFRVSMGVYQSSADIGMTKPLGDQREIHPGLI